MGKSAAGKGDDRRPQFVSEGEFARRWARTFGEAERTEHGTNSGEAERPIRPPARTD